jgi:Mg-chelatase subunit ChlD
MKQDYTEIVVLLDRSGSMQHGKDDHEGGLLSFVEDQQQLPGDVRFTLIQFDNVDPCEILYDGVPIAEVNQIKLIPRGGTPLLDAVGLTIAHVAERLGDSRPDQVVVMIITDGQENSSREYRREQIKQMIAEYEQTGWKFLYLGADVDAFTEAGGLAIAPGAALKMAKSKAGTQAAYRALSSNMLECRAMLQEDMPVEFAYEAYEFSEEQRRESME